MGTVHIPTAIDDVLSSEWSDESAEDFFDARTTANEEFLFQPLAPPPISRSYRTYDEAESKLHEWTTARGYGLRINRTNWINDHAVIKELKWRSFVCDRTDGRGKEYLSLSRQRKKNKRKRSYGCKMEVVLKLYEGRWVFDVKEPIYSHRASIGPLVHPSLRRRARQDFVSEAIRDAWNSGKSLRETVDMCRERFLHVPLIHRDVMNLRARLKRLELSGRSSLQDLLHRLEQEDSDFLSYHTHDAEDRLTRLLFFHKTSLELWRKNPDIILMDNTYKTNRFGLPLLNIVGVTSNNESFFIGNCFMRNENREGFLFILSHLKRLYKEAKLPLPRVFIIDADIALGIALRETFSASKHFFCVWYINKNI
jgi:hypothetical protein